MEPSECGSCELQAGQTLFTPHYSSRQCTSGLESEDCQHNCIHYGRYCSMDSIGDAYKDTFRGWQVCATTTTSVAQLREASCATLAGIPLSFASRVTSALAASGHGGEQEAALRL